jgi:hypothetical protein
MHSCLVFNRTAFQAYKKVFFENSSAPFIKWGWFKKRWHFLRLVVSLNLVILTECAFVPVTPCRSGGEPARETGLELIGTRKCTQVEDEKGEQKNHGLYREWYVSEKIALIGEYAWGKKHGRWIYYDESGKKTHEKYFLSGLEVSEEAFKKYRLKILQDPYRVKGEDKDA